MKVSKYNFYFHFEKEYYIFNSWKGSLLKLEKTKIEQIKNGIFDLFNDNETNLLLENGIITEQNEYKEILKENALSVKKRSDKVFSITILPTLNCNASCLYCFETGCIKTDMTYETIEKVSKFIKDNSKQRMVKITWFGGEPLLATNVISKISMNLKKWGIPFSSSMITNGFFIDKYLKEAINNWNLKRIQVTIDGLHSQYEDIKKMGAGSFEKVMSNIETAIENKIIVSVRVNFDSSNVLDYKSIIEYLYKRFKNSINIYFHDIVGKNYKAPYEMKTNPLVPILEELIKYGYAKTLKDLRIDRCYQACSINVDDFFNVAPDGTLTKCEHYVGKTSVLDCGTIECVSQKEKRFTTKLKCSECKMFPICSGGCWANNYERPYSGCHRLKGSLEKVLKIYLTNRKDNKYGCDFSKFR